uniref:WGS project CAEQ00000000 data, annotated contig 1420 n=1 Tax=Trypanosoma congolense (strain IL3000) TaxID=1068625 RepID=F9W634_TRYCI|nr:unnamed protein product [Trypanosoma congolense IL3000]
MGAPDGENLQSGTSAAQVTLNEAKRFGILVVGLFGCVCVSLTFGFNIFSGDLQQRYHFTQADMTTISTVGLVLSYFGIPYAIVYDYYGVRPVLAIGLVTMCSGLLFMALTFADTITASLVLLCVFNGIFNFASGLYDLACVVTTLTHFPTAKGWVVAVMKTFIGLGSALLGAIQLAFFERDPTNYFYFLLAFGATVGTLVLCFMRSAPYILTDYDRKRLPDTEIEKRLETKNVYLRQKPPTLRFVLGLLIIVILIIALPLQSALVAYTDVSPFGRKLSTSIIVAIWLLYPIVCLPFKCLDRGWKFWRDENRLNECTSDDQANNNSPTEGSIDELDYIPPQYHTRFIDSVKTLKLWALFWSLFCTLGAEFVILINTRFIFAALSGKEIDDSLNTMLTVLNGVGSASGRLLMSYFEIWSQGRKAQDRIPITISLFLPTILVAVMLVLFLTISNEYVLPVPYVVGALANGIIASVTVLVVNTIYAKDLGLHYNFCFLATACSTILYNRVLYGEWYTYQANKRGVEVCLDRECVQMPLIVLLALDLTALATNWYVHWEYVKLVRRVLVDRSVMAADRLIA